MGGKEGSSLMTFELRPKKKGMAMKIFRAREKLEIMKRKYILEIFEDRKKVTMVEW